jgi:hypothetical protein
VHLPTYKALNQPWTEEKGDTLVSPPLGGHWEQVVLFPEHQGNDYSIDVELTPIIGEDRDNVEHNTAGIIFRYSGENQYYYAGIGGFGASAFIGKVELRDGRAIWNSLASQGKREAILYGNPYKIRVECAGQQLSLYSYDDAKLTIKDGTYPAGYWGLRTVRTQARFSKISVAAPSVPQCFVIMPFITSLHFVYETIKATVEENDLQCHRVDDSAVAQPIVHEIWEYISEADLIVADLTGKNANVYYEAGLAHALGKASILLAQSQEDLAFDLKHIRTVFYSDPEDLRNKLAQAIQDTFWRPRRSPAGANKARGQRR